MAATRHAMSIVEWIAAALGVLCVGLGVLRSMWTFPTAIGSVLLLGVVVWRERLYSDAFLQLCFAVANVYGWVNWHRSRERTGDVVVERLSWTARAGWVVVILVISLGLGWAMARYTDAALPWWDAAVTSASLVAQWLMAQRRWENWALWLVVDVSAIWLYHVKKLEAFAALYVVYLVLSAWGLWRWLAIRRGAERPVALLTA